MGKLTMRAKHTVKVFSRISMGTSIRERTRTTFSMATASLRTSKPIGAASEKLITEFG